jgi:FAD binding domain
MNCDRDRRRLTGALLATPVAAGLTACERDATRTIEDVSRLHRTDVAAVLRPASTEAVSTALTRNELPVSIGGGRYSMGGQTACPGSLHLDMRGMRQLLHLDTEHRRVRVQAGMRWRDLQTLIDPHDLSVGIMQSYSNFTIGGSASVNCHGRYVGKGPLANSILGLRLVAADGSVHDIDRVNPNCSMPRSAAMAGWAWSPSWNCSSTATSGSRARRNSSRSTTIPHGSANTSPLTLAIAATRYCTTLIWRRRISIARWRSPGAPPMRRRPAANG